MGSPKLCPLPRKGLIEEREKSLNFQVLQRKTSAFLFCSSRKVSRSRSFVHLLPSVALSHFQYRQIDSPSFFPSATWNNATWHQPTGRERERSSFCVWRSLGAIVRGRRESGEGHWRKEGGCDCSKWLGEQCSSTKFIKHVEKEDFPPE